MSKNLIIVKSFKSSFETYIDSNDAPKRKYVLYIDKEDYNNAINCGAEISTYMGRNIYTDIRPISPKEEHWHRNIISFILTFKKASEYTRYKLKFL